MPRRLSFALALSLLLTQVVVAMPSALAAQAGIDGNTYTSPTHDWSISWSDAWTVEGERSEDGLDYLELTDQLSYVHFESYEEFEGDAIACVAAEESDLAAQEGVDDIEVGNNAAGDPLSGGDAGNAYSVYTFTYTGENGVESTLVEYNECRTLVAGESVLEISQITVRNAYNDASLSVQELLQTITLPGDEPREPADDPDATGDDGDAEGGELSAEQVSTAAEEAAADVVVFFADVFEARDLFYVPPFFEIIEEEAEAPCSEGAVHPGVGSFYCGLNQTVYFDLQREVSDASVGGIASPIYTIGHEAGHDVQMQLGITLGGAPSVEKELEADCMAGAFLAWEVDAEKLTEDEFFALLDLVDVLGDPAGTSATDPGAHGMGSQRVAMVLRGYYSGVDSCGTF